MDPDWVPKTTRYAASLQGTLFASRPLELHHAVLCAVDAAANIGLVSSSSTDAQLAQASRLREQALRFADSLYPEVEALVSPELEWLEVENRSAEAEAIAAPLVKRALDIVWGGRPEPAIDALGHLLERVAQDPAAVDGGLRMAAFRDLKTVEDFNGDLKDLQMTMALSAVVSGSPTNSMATAVSEAAEALLYAGEEQEARELFLDYCRAFARPALLPTPLAPLQEGSHLRSRLSALADSGRALRAALAFA